MSTEQQQTPTNPVIDTQNAEPAEKTSSTAPKPQTEKPRRNKELPKLPPVVPELMKEGDLVVAYFNPKYQVLFKLKSGAMQDTKYGHYRHDSIIGNPFFSKVKFSKR
jgi:hypothetical protein